MEYLNLLASSIGIISLIIASKGKYFSYIFLIISIVMESFISFKLGFYFNGGIKLIIFLPIGIWGLFSWWENEKNGVLRIEKLSVLNWILYIIFIMLGIWTFRYFYRLTWLGAGHIQPIIIVFTLVADLLMVERCLEHWYFRIVIHCFNVYLWWISYISGDSNMYASILLFINLIISFYGAYSWKRLYEIQIEK
ncbi:MAG: nicotinamide riboside transporter PnuC [Clostridium sp.]